MGLLLKLKLIIILVGPTADITKCQNQTDVIIQLQMTYRLSHSSSPIAMSFCFCTCFRSRFLCSVLTTSICFVFANFCIVYTERYGVLSQNVSAAHVLFQPLSNDWGYIAIGLCCCLSIQLDVCVQSLTLSTCS